MPRLRLADASQSSPSAADRLAPRRLISVACIASNSALGRVPARASNLSRIGCRVEVQCRFHRGDFVMLTFPTLSPVGARVAWSTGRVSGVEFANPLNVAVLDHLLALHGPQASLVVGRSA